MAKARKNPTPLSPERKRSEKAAQQEKPITGGMEARLELDLEHDTEDSRHRLEIQTTSTSRGARPASRSNKSRTSRKDIVTLEPAESDELESTKKPWTAEEKLQVIDLYIAGTTFQEMSKKLSRSAKSIRKVLDTYQFNLANAKASRLLPVMGKTQETSPRESYTKEWEVLQNPEVLNVAFFELLSPPSSPTLSDAEIKFCWSYVSSLDLDEAIFASGFDAGLYTEDKSNPAGAPIGVQGFDACIKMRIAYLKSKPNIQAFIKRIRKEAILNVGVDKDFLQKEILLQIEGLKLSQTMDSKKLLRDYILMLGRSFGAFTDKLEVEEIDHGKTIEKLMAASKVTQGQKLIVEAGKAEATLKEAAAIREKEARERNRALAAMEQAATVKDREGFRQDA
jgi:hypothetical protein